MKMRIWKNKKVWFYLFSLLPLKKFEAINKITPIIIKGIENVEKGSGVSLIISNAIPNALKNVPMKNNTLPTLLCFFKKKLLSNITDPDFNRKKEWYFIG